MGELLPEEIEFVQRMEGRARGRGDGLLQVPAADADNASIVSATELATIDRETWGSKIDFLLSVIGVFLIPYLLMLLLAGIPLFYMELCLGQYYRQGAITTWGKICPLFKGIGYCVVLIAFYTDFFYNVIIAWSLHFFVSSFGSPLPWSTCDHEWNSRACYGPTLWADSRGLNDTVCRGNFLNETLNVTQPISSSDEYYYKRFLALHEQGNPDNKLIATVENPGRIQYQTALCLFAVYIICYFSLWKGIKMSGKVVWFTAVFPYVVLLILLVRGVTLPGAIDGIRYYLWPSFEKLKEGRVWIEASTQVFFSLGPGFGVLMAFASYNKFHNNVYHDAMLTSTINCATSFLAGFVIFSVLGYMSCKSGRPIESVALDGPGLVFVVYPEALATMPGSNVWALVFFMMLLTLGLDSSFGGSEAIITALSDEFPRVKKHRELFVLALFTLYFVVGLLMVTQAGILFVEFVNYYAASTGLLIAVFCETIVVSWIYGLDRFAADIKEMLGFEPGIYWRFCWKFIGPAFLLFNVVSGIVSHESHTFQGYKYPRWMNMLGWALAMSSASAIPIVAIHKLFTAPGDTFRQRVVGQRRRLETELWAAGAFGVRNGELLSTAQEAAAAAVDADEPERPSMDLFRAIFTTSDVESSDVAESLPADVA